MPFEALNFRLAVAIRIDSRLADEINVVRREGDDVVEDIETKWLFAVRPAELQSSPCRRYELERERSGYLELTGDKGSHQHS
jgi:hypothetical protein